MVKLHRLGYWVLGGLLPLASPRALTGQVAVQASGGSLLGAVRDGITGQPRGFALITLAARDLRVFANDAPGGLDTITSQSDNQLGYRRGRVIARRRWRGRDVVVNYFTVGDIARREFQKYHCFWYAGPDTADGRSVYRIEFAPVRGLKSAPGGA